MDRGPFGRLHRGPQDGRRRWYNGAPLYRAALKRARKRGTQLAEELPAEGWRGCIDLTPSVARAIGHSGLEPVMVIQ